ncbi:MAG: hypothetical protein ACOX8U_03075 [Bradymonadia bacterium]|jgi:hypothetical protein
MSLSYKNENAEQAFEAQEKLTLEQGRGVFFRALQAMPSNLWLVVYPILGSFFNILAWVSAIYVLLSPLQVLLQDYWSVDHLVKNGVLALLASFSIYVLATSSSAFFETCFWGRVHESFLGLKKERLHVGLRHFFRVLGLKLLFHCLYIAWGLASVSLLILGFGSSIFATANFVPSIVFLILNLLVYAFLNIVQNNAYASLFLDDNDAGNALLDAVHKTLQQPSRYIAVFAILALISAILSVHEFFIQLLQWNMDAPPSEMLSLSTQIVIVFFAFMLMVLRPLMWLSANTSKSRRNLQEPSAEPDAHGSPGARLEQKNDATQTTDSALRELPYDFKPNPENILRPSMLLK